MNHLFEVVYPLKRFLTKLIHSGDGAMIDSHNHIIIQSCRTGKPRHRAEMWKIILIKIMTCHIKNLDTSILFEIKLLLVISDMHAYSSIMTFLVSITVLSPITFNRNHVITSLLEIMHLWCDRIILLFPNTIHGTLRYIQQLSLCYLYFLSVGMALYTKTLNNTSKNKTRCRNNSNPSISAMNSL